MILRRKRFLIEPRFQIRFALTLAGVGLAVAFGASMAGYLAFKPLYQQFAQSYYNQSPELSEQLVLQVHQLKISLILLTFGVAGFCVLGGILISHRIVGPLYQLRKAMEKVSEGNLEQRLRFRQGDDFENLAETFNRMMEAIRSDHSKDRIR